MANCTLLAYSADIPAISARSAVVINAETKEILYEKNAYDKRSMASTTKIMTSILALESGRLSDVVTAQNVNSEGTSIGLSNGYKLTVEALVWGMMLESGNDAAELVAEYFANSEENFAVLMNNKAAEIGMCNTNFVTASGLDSEGHCSTAYDMALLGAYAVNNPSFREICSTKTKRVEFIEPACVRVFSNHNRLISMCEGVFGIKTGFTKKSGRCLVSACERDDVVLVAVTLNAGDDWNDHIKLFEYGYDKITDKQVYARVPERVRVYGGSGNFALISLQENPVKISVCNEDYKITQKIILPDFVYAPIMKGDSVGKVQLLTDNKVICERDIVCTQSIAAIEQTTENNIFTEFLSRFKGLFR